MDRLGFLPPQLRLADRMRKTASEQRGAIDQAIAKGQLGDVKLDDRQKQALTAYAAMADGGPAVGDQDQRIVAALMLSSQEIRAQIGADGVATFASALSMRDLVRNLGGDLAESIAGFIREHRSDPASSSNLMNQIASLRRGTMPLRPLTAHARAAVEQFLAGGKAPVVDGPPLDTLGARNLRAQLDALTLNELRRLVEPQGDGQGLVALRDPTTSKDFRVVVDMEGADTRARFTDAIEKAWAVAFGGTWESGKRFSVHDALQASLAARS